MEIVLKEDQDGTFQIPRSKKRYSLIEFLSPILAPKIAVKKQSIVDVLCKDKMGVKYIIEMQVTKTRGFEKRAQYYASQVYGSQANIGDEYHVSSKKLSS